MAEDEKDTSKIEPDGGDVAPAGDSQVETDPSSQDAVAGSTNGPSDSEQKQEGADEEPQYRYLGKTYKDIHSLEEAHANLLGKLNEQGREKNTAVREAQQELLDSLEERLRADAGTDDDQTASRTQRRDPAQDAILKEVERLRSEHNQLRLRQAKQEEDAALDELVRAKPHLAPVREEIRAAWTVTNKPLGKVAERFEKLVSIGRNSNKEDALRKQEQQVETGKGAGEIEKPIDQDKFNRAMKSGKIEDWADALPDRYGL